MKAFFITIPHSGEKVPEQAAWLQNLPEPVLMDDVDRYVDLLYSKVIEDYKIPLIKTEWHRYVADLNRIPSDIDCDSVLGNKNPSGSFDRGFHWVVTTHNYKLMPQPISEELHQYFVDLVYDPFHRTVKKQYDFFKQAGFSKVYHLDLHSMPSVGTSMHRDPGEKRADIVVSDCKGKSCQSSFKDLVISCYEKAGFKVAYNWPYFGGRVSEMYGNPAIGQETIQVELNRGLYMDEKTKKINPDVSEIKNKLYLAIENLYKSNF